MNREVGAPLEAGVVVIVAAWPAAKRALLLIPN